MMNLKYIWLKSKEMLKLSIKEHMFIHKYLNI